jgi:hypothetical protein
MRYREAVFVGRVMQPILDSPVQVCIDGQVRGQDRGVRFLDLARLLVAQPLLVAQTRDDDERNTQPQPARSSRGRGRCGRQRA